MNYRLRAAVTFPPQRVCLLRTHAIGDVLLTTPAIRAIKLAWPETHLTMLVGNRARPVLEGNPYIDSLQSFPEEWWFEHCAGKILKLTRRLRRQPKDCLILFHASPLIHMWGFLLKAESLVGFDEDGSGFALTHRVKRTKGDDQRYLGDINCDLARGLGIPVADARLDFILESAEIGAVRRFLPSLKPTEPRWLIGVAPGRGQECS